MDHAANIRNRFSNIAKFLTPATYYSYAIERAKLHLPNAIVNRTLGSCDWSKLSECINQCELPTLSIDAHQLSEWAQQCYPHFLDEFGSLEAKKMIEFYTSFRLLEPDEKHVFLDVAGGQYTYVHNLPCNRKILHDLKIDETVRDAVGGEVEYIESDAGSIPLPDQSIDRISCHHSFEHFKGDSDIAFLKEIQRLLKVEGACCIVPLFIGKWYAEITDTITLKLKFDSASHRLIDPTATISGSAFSGNYARIYDITAFKRRILANVDLSQFKITLFELKLNQNRFPDLNAAVNRRVAKLEFPYRAMVIRKVSS